MDGDGPDPSRSAGEVEYKIEVFLPAFWNQTDRFFVFADGASAIIYLGLFLMLPVLY